MTDCEFMTDKMALVLHGRAAWTGEEATHVRECTACAAEWRIVEAAKGVGTTQARSIEPARVARVVVARLQAARRWRRASWLAMAAAAAIAILVWTQVPAGRRTEPVASTAGFHLPLAELDHLDATQLRAVLDNLDGPLGGSASPDAPGLGGLENQELELVLRSLEG